MDDLYIVVVGTMAGFSAVGVGLRMQAKALDKLAEAIEKVRDRIDVIQPPDHTDHDRLVAEVSRIALRQVQIGTELENIRHTRRENDGG